MPPEPVKIISNSISTQPFVLSELIVAVGAKKLSKKEKLILLE